MSYVANQSTPTVSFTYDPAYSRLSTMTDGNGTTTYSYYPISTPASLGANQLESVRSPIANQSGSDTVVYSYDALNRVVGQTVNGAAQAIGFDALGRVTSMSNPLDAFTYSYSDGTARVTGVSSNDGPTSAMTYYGPTGDELLEQLKVTMHTGGTTLQQYGYTYNADDNVLSNALTTPSAQTTTYAYDTANRLLSGLFSGSNPQYAYQYDAASNLTSITANGPTETYSYSSTNSISGGSYDNNGSPTTLAGDTYTWDGANRILSWANPANHTSSSFTYDGYGRLVRVVDSKNGGVTADHSYTWCGSMRCLAHNNLQSGSPVSTQYFPQGVIANGADLYYVQDHLGSVTMLVSNTGSVAAQYAYDPYGNKTTVSGNVVSDIGYAGYFYHAQSGLDFAMFRAYDPVHARWLNRDPIAEAGGINLYAYVGGDPLSNIDPLGLIRYDQVGSSVVGIISSGVGIIVGGALIAAPTGISQVIGVGVIAKSAYGFGTGFYSLARALSDDDSLDLPSNYASLPRAIASTVSCSNDAQRLADAAELALDLAAGRATAGFAPNASGFLKNATGYPMLNSNQFTHAATFAELSGSDLNALANLLGIYQAAVYVGAAF